MDSHKRGSLWNRIIIIFIVALIATVCVVSAYGYYLQRITKQVTIVDDGFRYELTTFGKTVEYILNRYDISLRPEDEISPGINELLDKETEITITRAMMVKVMADGEEKEVYLTRGTVNEALYRSRVELGDDDIVNHNLSDQVFPGMLIHVTRIDKKSVIERESIAYEIISKPNPDLNEGVVRVVQEGNQGEYEREILVTYRDGEEFLKEVLREEVVVEPVDRIVERGTAKTVATSRGNVVRYSSVGQYTATAYTAGKESTGKTPNHPQYGITASGKRVKPYHTIAAPPEVPFGTKVYIPEAVEFWKQYGIEIDGIFVVEDRGSAIVGNRIDIFMDDTVINGKRRSARNIARNLWGRRKVTVYFLR